MLASYVSRLSGTYEKDYVDDNDCFLKFLIVQKHMFSKVIEDVKTKLYQAVSMVNKDVMDGHKDRIASSRRKLADIDVLLLEREKHIKK